MTRVVFYHNAPDRLQASCDFLLQAYAQKKTMTVFVADPRRADDLDRMLWTQPPTGFLPHCAADSPLAAETPILLAKRVETLAAAHSANDASDANESNEARRVFNLTEEIPDDVIAAFSHFSSLIEIVGRDPDERERARERVLRYKAAGFVVKYTDLAEQG